MQPVMSTLAARLLSFAPVLLLIPSIGTPAEAVPTLAWDIAGGTASSPGGTPRANGARFSLAQESEIVALGIFDHQADGLSEPHVITLWSDDGAQLVQAIVGSGGVAVASMDSDGQWIFESIEPLVLAAGIYRVAAGYGVAGGDEVRSTSTLVTSLAADYIEQAYTNSGQGVATFPSFENDNPVFGANLLIESAAVPEPSTALLLAMGLFALGRGAARREHRGGGAEAR